jgi:DNA-binding MurR/RpiR family transcriptional regulator
MARTLESVSDAPEDALAATLDRNLRALESLRHDISPERFRAVVAAIAAAPRVRIFGIGPSSAIAAYFAIQLGRFGLDAGTLTSTGLSLADELHALKPGDVLVVLAYTRPYREVTALIARAKALRLPTILITDALGKQLTRNVDHILVAPRGGAGTLSLHTATLAVLEAVLVGVAAHRPVETLGSLKALNSLRAQVAGRPMDLPQPEGHRQRRGRTPRFP